MPPAKTVAAPVCVYATLTPDELDSPGVWAGAFQANTGTLVPGRFPVAPVAYYAGEIPDAMKGLGVVPYYFECNGTKKLVYGQVATPGTAGSLPETRQLTPPVAAQLEAEITVPGLSVGLSPAPEGITGLASSFWVTGYDGAPIYQAATGSAGTGWLRATPRYYRWSFGDGSGMTTTSLGQAWPAASAIVHTYDVRSDRSPLATNGTYRVSVTVLFDVAFQVSVPGQTLVPNGTWVEFSSLGLPPLQATAGSDYKVREVRGVLTG